MYLLAEPPVFHHELFPLPSTVHFFGSVSPNNELLASCSHLAAPRPEQGQEFNGLYPCP